MHGRVFYLHEMRYGFEEETLLRAYRSLRRGPLGSWKIPSFRITIGGAEEVTLVVHLERGHVRGFAVEKGPRVLAESENLSRKRPLNGFWKWPSTRTRSISKG